MPCPYGSWLRQNNEKGPVHFCIGKETVLSRCLADCVAHLGHVCHVLNRAVGRVSLFNKQTGYAAFEKMLRQAWDRLQMRLLSVTILPNHWRLATDFAHFAKVWGEILRTEAKSRKDEGKRREHERGESACEL